MTQNIHQESHERVDELTRTLRAAGTLVLMGAASTFLLGKWAGIHDVPKYAILLLHTVMLVIAGIVTSAKAHDSRTARTFMLLSLGAIPVNFAITGGFLYSQLSIDGASKRLPFEVTWLAPSLPIALALALGSAAILFGVGLIAARSLLRQQTFPVIHALLATSAVLWLPVREPSLIGVALLGFACMALYREATRWKDASCMRTPEGRIVRAIIISPILIGLGRTLIFYGSSGVFLGAALMVIGLSCFLLGNVQEREEGLVLPVFSALTATVGAACVIADLAHTLELGQVTPIWFVPALAVMIGFSSAKIAARAALHQIAAWLAVWLVLITVPFQFTPGNLFVALGLGVLVLSYGTWERLRLLAVNGTALAVIGLVGIVSKSIHFGSVATWIVLSGFGFTFILSAVLVERYRTQLVRYATRFRDHWQEQPSARIARKSEGDTQAA
ncbi:MAG TPA: hypothetical protein VL137_18200 [Polyangiaceae bacterium]|nr:hypothetical protein [Polyangiaceae bacterium]